MIFEFYTWDYSKYVGIFSGKDWMDARHNASKTTGIPVNDLVVYYSQATIFPQWENAN
jgi:hypothetical protein